MAPPTFAEATAVKATGSHTYTAHFPTEWCIGSVTHGGVVTATILRVAATHFGTTLAAQKQPHTITLHAEFLRRTKAGDATFKVKDVKLGRQTSTIHVSLSQKDGREEQLVVAYVTNADMGAEQGLTLPTGWTPDPRLPPKPTDFARLAKEGEDGGGGGWVELRDLPHRTLRKAANRVRMHVPRAGQAAPNVVDEWIRLDSGERMTAEAVGFVADMWPQMMDAMVARQREQERGQSQSQSQGGSGDHLPWLWYPTLVLNLDFKKALPPQGVDWLHVRLHAKQIRNGRYDYEVVIFDEQEEIVALSHHVALVLDGTRNTAGRKGGDGSKI
ncbi:thioesterase-like superfamily-domain-containing protein [Xylariaceae sp. FL0594]|nr:thioesterase-like superfamily-domain-containing protein [Xylariaceae sp. FL0594]